MMKFTELEKTLREQGYCDDDLMTFDRQLVESACCRNKSCRRQPLRYVGLSVANRYRFFGVCPKCDGFREFGDERVPSFGNQMRTAA